MLRPFSNPEFSSSRTLPSYLFSHNSGGTSWSVRSLGTLKRNKYFCLKKARLRSMLSHNTINATEKSTPLLDIDALVYGWWCFDYSQWSCGNSFPFLRRRKNRDLLQLGRQRQGRRRLKNKYIFFVGISRMTGCVYLLLQRRKLTSAKRMRAALSSKWKLKSFAVGVSFLGPRKFWWYHVVILQRTAKRCTQFWRARIELLFFALVLCHVLVAVAVVVC